MNAEARIARSTIEAASREVERLNQVVRDVAKEHIEDFHFLDYRVSMFWTCDASPIGMCLFHLDDNGRMTRCRYCGGPVERK